MTIAFCQILRLIFHRFWKLYQGAYNPVFLENHRHQRIVKFWEILAENCRYTMTLFLIYLIYRKYLGCAAGTWIKALLNSSRQLVDSLALRLYYFRTLLLIFTVIINFVSDLWYGAFWLFVTAIVAMNHCRWWNLTLKEIIVRLIVYSRR